jgi:hypothetical protein
MCLFLVWTQTGTAAAQELSHRGFVEGTTFVFPQTTPEDQEHVVGDLMAREEFFARPLAWMQLAGGVELRANSHDQVEGVVAFVDRGARRPWLALRTLSAALTRGPFTFDVGKQFIRWGKTDIVAPTDRFAPRDFLNLLDAPFMPITGVRATAQFGTHTIETAWVPIFTPSRVPLLDQRWAPRPDEVPSGVQLVETPPSYPHGSQIGVRIGNMASRADYALSYFDGFNHEPDIRLSAPDPVGSSIEFRKVYPSIRTYGADVALPLRRLALLKAEAAYFTAPANDTDEYVLYVVQLERQHGEWVFVGGYAGEVVTEQRAALSFAPDRGLSRSLVGRASYTIDANRSLEIESAARQDGDGVYVKAQYSLARGQHWRTTLAGVVIAGEPDDFIGQYRRNSHVRLTVRYSF